MQIIKHSTEYIELSNPQYGRIFFGPVPGDEDFKIWKAMNVMLVWNLLAELPDLAQQERKTFMVRHTPIRDYGIPDRDIFMYDLNHVTKWIKMGQSIAVHCLGGHGRTGMALACLLMRLEDISAEEALSMTKNICHGPENEKQKEFVRGTDGRK